MQTTLRPGEFYGETRTRQIIPGFQLMEAVYPPAIELPKHSHECACFSLMVRGGMKENYGRRTLESYKQTVGFNAADEPHSNTISSNGARFLILQLGVEQTKRAQQYSARFNTSAVFNHGELSWLGLRLFQEAEQDDAVSPLAIEGLALEMIAMLCRLNEPRGNRPPHWLTQAHDLLRDQFAEPLSVATIAKTVDVHPVHLSRTFRKRYGSSIGDYVRSLRIEKARSLLSSTALPLAEIATTTGFYDQAHLSRVFKRRLRMTPAQYRRAFRPGNRPQEI
ncbi:MAG TPA: helix-turn-helix domain-containing protein [Pyrinomonadaceae bacterium]|nr:helix-turn-helix domain-containing protein [Pyrinomonadaceae bacterium]